MGCKPKQYAARSGDASDHIKDHACSGNCGKFELKNHRQKSPYRVEKICIEIDFFKEI